MKIDHHAVEKNLTRALTAFVQLLAKEQGSMDEAIRLVRDWIVARMTAWIDQRQEREDNRTS